MSSLNKVTLIGNLGRDPEVRNTQDGKPVVNLSIATSDSWTDKHSGERREKTEWHRIVIFNEHIGGVVQKYCRKGSKIYIEGQLQTRKWTDQAGVERYTTEIVVPNFRGNLVLLDSRQSDSGSGSGGREDGYGPEDYGESAGGTKSALPRGQTKADLDDEIPSKAA